MYCRNEKPNLSYINRMLIDSLENVQLQCKIGFCSPDLQNVAFEDYKQTACVVIVMTPLVSRRPLSYRSSHVPHTGIKPILSSWTVQATATAGISTLAACY